MNKVDYTKQSRTLENDYTLISAEVDGLTQRLRSLSARSPDTLSPKERQELAGSLNGLDQEIQDKQADKLRIRNEQLELEAQRAAGFDYERPASSLLNRLLPAIPPDTKEVTRAIVTDCATKRHWILAIVLAIASFGFAFWLLQMLSVGALLGAALFLLGTTLAEPSLSTHMVGVVGWSVATAVFAALAMMRPQTSDYPHSDRIARFFLGAERWNWLQRSWVCVVYSVSSPWIVIAPLIIVPIRLMIALALLWIYLHTEDSPTSAPEAIATTGRLYSAYQRVMLVGGAIVSALVVILLIVM